MLNDLALLGTSSVPHPTLPHLLQSWILNWEKPMIHPWKIHPSFRLTSLGICTSQGMQVALTRISRC